MSPLTRRKFLQVSLLSGSTMVLAPASLWSREPGKNGDARQYVSLFTGRTYSGIATTCGLCSAGCGVLAFLEEGNLIGLAGNPDHPYSQGGLCALGSSAMNQHHSQDRIRKPLRRRLNRGGDAWDEISWEEAYETIVSLMKLKGQKKPCLAVSAPGRDLSPLVHRFMSALSQQGTQGIIEDADNYELPVEKAINRAFGFPRGGVADLENAEYVLNFGADFLGSVRKLVGAASLWAAGRETGARWVTLDPRLSETANRSHEWIPVRPGTDGVFAAAVAHVILKRGWENRSFLTRRTDLDSKSLWNVFGPWTPERAGKICQVSAETIRSVAREFARSSRSVAVYGSGVTARERGGDTACAVLMLNLLVGNIDRKGGYQVIRPHGWQQPEPRFAGKQVPYLGGTLFRDLSEGKREVGCLISCHANPAVTDPDCTETVKTLKDLEKIPFHVALSSTMNQTVRLADIVLPAATYLETWGLGEGFSPADGSYWIGLRQPVLKPGGEYRGLDEVLLEIARRAEGALASAFPFESVEKYYLSLLGETFPLSNPVELMASMKKNGFGLSPKGRKKGAGQGGESEGILSSGDARFELAGLVSETVPRLSLPVEKKTKPIERTLILYASPFRDPGAPPSRWLDELDHCCPVWVHPEAAAEIGCNEGDWVRVKGPAGEVRTRVRLTQGIHPEAVAMQSSAIDPEAGRGADFKAEAGKDPDASLVWWEADVYGENAQRIIPWPENPEQEAPGWTGTRVMLEGI